MVVGPLQVPVAIHRYGSPLRYPGGKAKLAPVLRELITANNLGDGVYAEPYAGGAGLALTLLFDDYVRRIHINDLDRSIFAFWHSVLHDADRLCRLIDRAPLTSAYWNRQREIQDNKEQADLLTLGFSTFYLNRTNRSGIIASGGMIGGTHQDGPWLLGARYNRPALIARIRRINAHRGRISLSHSDALDFLGAMAAALPARSLTYLDPPYFIKGQRRLYANYYGERDHAAIAGLLDSYPHCWLVSYDYTPEILALYKRHRCYVYRLRYTAAARRRGAEVMFFSDQLQVPAARGAGRL